jgi:hypothetical protein
VASGRGPGATFLSRVPAGRHAQVPGGTRSNSRTVTGMQRALPCSRRWPVHPSALTVAVLLAALLTGVSGCGGGGGDGVKPRVWAADVCQALAPWRAEITNLNAQAAQDTQAATNPTQTRDSLVRLLSGAQHSSEQARVKVEAAGAPDVKDGLAIAARFVHALAAVRDAYAKAQRSIEALPLGRAKTFYDGVEATMGTLRDDYAAAGVNTTSLASADLRASFDEVPACNAA